MKTLAFNCLMIVFLLQLTSQTINIPNCKDSLISIKLKDTTGTVDPTTSVTLCHDLDYLYVNWQNVDSDIISTYTKCNDPLYNEDAVQIFLSSPESYLANHYYEFEVSPKGVLFLSDIYNPSGNCSKFSGESKSCDLVEYSGKIMKTGWEAKLKAKLSFLGRGQKAKYLMGNIFRIDKTTNKPTRYLAMNPTGTPTPCFHVSAKFEKFVLMGVNSQKFTTN